MVTVTMIWLYPGHRDNDMGAHGHRDNDMGTHGHYDNDMGIHGHRDNDMGAHGHRDNDKGTHGYTTIAHLYMHHTGQNGCQLLLSWTADDGLLVRRILCPQGGEQTHKHGQNVGADLETRVKM